MRIKQFQGTTADDMKREIAELQRQGLRGLIIDLRGNPGGLLDQAIRVSDIFVDSGTLVTTVGYAGKQRDEKRARNDGNEPKIPVIVLVSGNSASASEIVAGALKNLDRAVILGQTTFGKGSVQVLYDNDDESALKLTIAQYLTPGDVSIQSVGITPDVQTVPVRVEKDTIWFAPPQHTMLRESELEQHLDSRNVKKGEKPEEVVRYLAPPPKKAPAALRDDDDEAEPEEDSPPIVDENQPVEDFDIDVARDLLASLPSGVWRRHDVLAAARPMLERTRAAEEQKVAAALAKLSIDWSDGPAQGPAKLSASVTTDRPANRLAAGQTVTLRATVKNDGPGVARQLRGKIKSDYYLFDEREVVFGKVGPGESKTAELQIKVPKDALTQIDDLKLEFAETHGAKVDPADVKLQIDGLPRPTFAYTYQMVDDGSRGNGNGQIERGEHVRVLVTVKNLGPGRSYKAQTTLKNNSGAGIFIHKGRFRIDNLLPGQTKQVAFELEVLPELSDDTVNVELAVGDQTLHEYINEKLKFPVVQAGKAPQASSGSVAALKDHTELRSAPLAEAPVVGYAQKGAGFKVTGKTGDFFRVDVEPGHPAFVAAAAVKTAAGTAHAGSGFEPTWMVSPPVLAVSTTALETTEGKVHLRGAVKDDRKVSDVYIIVQNRNAKIDLKKVFYKSNRDGQDKKKIDFDTDVPLWPGENYVHIVARENPQVQSRQTLVVLRSGGGALASPGPSAQRLPPVLPGEKP
jgi:carboxyl-terminal processing protease